MRRLDKFEIIEYNDFDFHGCQDNIKSLSLYLHAIIWYVILGYGLKHNNANKCIYYIFTNDFGVINISLCGLYVHYLY